MDQVAPPAQPPVPGQPDAAQQAAVPQNGAIPGIDQAPAVGQAPGLAQQAQVPVAQTDQALPNDVSTTTSEKQSKIIEDTDLIEKQWVDRVKHIIDQNRDDPYKQSQLLTEVRAEYMRKQYNKDIKIET